MPQRFLRLRQVREYVPFSSATIYRMISRGTFPSPHKVDGGRCSAWLESEVQTWIAAQTAQAA